MAFTILFTLVAPALNPFNPPVAEAADSCSAGGLTPNLNTRVGGVALDQAATFLANMDDITGAYYDSNLDRIVFVGKKNTTLPQFDKDDLAVAIKAVVFNNSIPAVSMDFDNGDPNSPNLRVHYFGGIENTRFGKVLFDADNKLKSYIHGYNEDGSELRSSVPGYRSFFDLFLDKDPGQWPNSQGSRHWITPRLISLRKDDASSSFVFDQTVMQVLTEPSLSNNDPKWNQAAQEFADFQTNNYDAFAQETPAYGEAKQLGKIVAVVKWLKDNNIQTDFNFARDYTPLKVATPVTIPKRSTPVKDRAGVKFQLIGGVNYYTANTYNQDTTGASASLKTSSQAVQTTKEDIHWTFIKDGQQYDSVAVAADAFRSLGSYSTASTDMSFPATGDLSLEFTRSYSSFSGGQKGIGRGWEFLPAKLVNNKSGWVTCEGHPWQLGLQTQEGYESFVFSNCATGEYRVEKPEYHTKLKQNSDLTFTATLKDQSQYNFDQFFKLTSYKDAHGNSISYDYDASDKVTAIKDPRGNNLTLSYNPEGLISTLTDWTGRQVKYGYDGQKNLINVTDPQGGVTRYGYNSNNKLVTIINKLGQTVLQNSYTTGAKIATSKDAGGVTTSFSYNNISRTINATDNLGRVGKAVYDIKARILEATNALNGIIKYSYGAEYAPTAVTDKKGNVTRYSYDANGNNTSITYPNTTKVDFNYDANRNLLTQIVDNRYPKTTFYNYDTANNMIEKFEAGKLTRYNYTNGEMVSATDPFGRVTTYTRDNFGNVLKSTDPLGNVTNYNYDSLGRLQRKVDPSNKVTTYGYDANGNVTTELTASGTTFYNYDKENRLVKTTSPKNTVTNFTYNNSSSLTDVIDPASTTTSYTYNQYQNLISKKDGLGRVSNNSYDKLDRQLTETTPMGRATRNEYDANGNVSKRTDALGQATIYTYDNLNRLIKTAYPNGVAVTRTYDQRGNLRSITNSGGTTWFTYDVFDRVTGVSGLHNQSNVSYSYDSNDNLTKISYPDTWFASYTYDASNRLTTVTDYAGTKTQYTYFKNGDISSRTLPNGIVTFYNYDGSDRLSSIEHRKGSTSLAKFVYQRDSLGNITKVTESGSFIDSAANSASVAAVASGSEATPSASANLNDNLLDTREFIATVSAGLKSPSPSPTPTPVPSAQPSASPLSWLINWLIPQAHAQTTPTQYTTNFSYDSLSRVTGATYPGAATYSYSYDKVGNRLNQVIKGVSTAYSYNNDNQITKAGTTNYSFNLNGNLIAKGSQTFTSNFENMMSSYKSPSITATYVYDGLGNRWTKTVNGTLTRYINDLSGPLSRNLGELGSGPQTLNYNLYGIGLISQGDYNAPSRQYLLEDGMGNTRFLTDSSGNMIRSIGYDPYGNQRTSTGGGSTKFKFDQQWVDTESNLYYLRARYYDPTTGRFTSKDPVNGVLTDPQTQNPYAYALNNPIVNNDPSGQFVPLLIAGTTLAVLYAPYIGLAADQIGQDLQRCDYGGAVSDALNFVPLPIGKITKGPKVVQKLLNVIIKHEHAAQHIEGTNLTREAVEAAIKADINGRGAGQVGETLKRTVNVGGNNLEYHMYTLEDGSVSVGTYFIPK